jgi:spore maturation protein CgeB
MKFVIFGLTLSSSWGNGHATLWRGLIRALARQGNECVFFERDVPYYAAHRDLTTLNAAELILYSDWSATLGEARRQVHGADVAVVTSYCPDAVSASELIHTEATHARSVFYDLDTPVTLARVRAGQAVEYLPREGLTQFDLVLSLAGGAALDQVRELLGARHVAALHSHADPDMHHPVQREERFNADLSYLGTYAADRQQKLEALFVEPARRAPTRRFLLGGTGYPADFPWTRNIWYVWHVPPAQHPSFFCSSRLTLDLTRRDMAAMGFCPTGRLFEATACGAPVLTDGWPGLERFFSPGEQILVARSSEEVSAALDIPQAELARMGRAARDRTLDEHSSAHRARELINILERRPPGP